MGNKHKRSIRRDADALSLIMPYIGDQKWPPKIGQCYKVESGLITRIPKHGQTT